jgi:hypothetical protein
MVMSLHAPSRTSHRIHGQADAMSAPLPGSHTHDMRAMVVFLIATLAIWLWARVILY